MTQILNEQDFEQYVYDAQGKVLVEFFATWCPHCQKMQPLVDQLAEDAAGAQVYQLLGEQSREALAELIER